MEFFAAALGFGILPASILLLGTWMLHKGLKRFGRNPTWKPLWISLSFWLAIAIFAEIARNFLEPRFYTALPGIATGVAALLLLAGVDTLALSWLRRKSQS